MSDIKSYFTQYSAFDVLVIPISGPERVVKIRNLRHHSKTTRLCQSPHWSHDVRQIYYGHNYDWKCSRLIIKIFFEELKNTNYRAQSFKVRRIKCLWVRRVLLLHMTKTSYLTETRMNIDTDVMFIAKQQTTSSERVKRHRSPNNARLERTLTWFA